MTADSRSSGASPIAIRIARPYSTEDEYLENELDTLTRASITLLGAQPRAEGVVLRFEVALTSGVVLVRGEGRVVGFKPNAHQGLGGLSLRFTRLDTRSKALIDRAAAMREKRRPSLRVAAPDPLSTPDPLPDIPIASLAPAPPPRPTSVPPPLPLRAKSSVPPRPPSAAPSPSRPPPGVSYGPPSPLARVDVATPSRPPPPPPPTSSSAAPPDREALLERLRARARTLNPIAIQKLFDHDRGPE